MKKVLVLCLTALLALSVCACAPAGDTTYTVTKNGVDYVVDQENGTISDGTYTYQFTLSGDSSGYSITITYPDGSTYKWQNNGNFGSGSASMDYDPDRYADAFVLCDVVGAGVPSARDGGSPGMILIALFLLGAGLFNVISPYNAWYLRYGWRYKDTEPSELALTIGRMGGVVIVVIAVILLFSSW